MKAQKIRKQAPVTGFYTDLPFSSSKKLYTTLVHVLSLRLVMDVSLSNYKKDILLIVVVTYYESAVPKKASYMYSTHQVWGTKP